MIEEVCIAIAMVLVTFYFWRRQHKFAQLKHQNGPPSAAPSSPFDVIVIGGGAGGCAAARSCVEKGAKSVLLVESGTGVIGSMMEPLSFSPDLAQSSVDYGIRSTRVFLDAGNNDEGLPYPRGHIIGGTSSIDWGMHLAAAPSSLVGFPDLSPVDSTKKKSTSKKEEDDAINHPIDFPVTLAATQRSPLSWAFAEACAAALMKRVMPKTSPKKKSEGALQEVGVQPVFQRVSAVQGTRNFVPHVLLGGSEGARITVWCGTKVVGITMDGKRATGIKVKASSAATSKNSKTTMDVCCAKGVIVAAGVVYSPTLLHPILEKASKNSSGAVFNFTDAISIPLIYQSLPGLSNDFVNIQSLKNILAWYAMRKGGLLNVVCDTAFVADVPKSGGAQVMVFLQPSGGYRHLHFKKWNLAPALGVFREGIMFHICVHKLGKGVKASHLGSVKVGDSLGGEEKGKDGQHSATKIILEEDRSAEDEAHIKSILAHGIKLCRDVMTHEPLSHLTTGREAIDCSLLSGSALSFDEKLAYKILYSHKVAEKTKKQSEAANAPFKKMLQEIATVAQQDEYVYKYINKHSRLAGYGCGTCTSHLEKGTKQVAGTRNVFVGDTSSIDGEVAAFELGFVPAGSTASAMDAGAKAGEELMLASS